MVIKYSKNTQKYESTAEPVRVYAQKNNANKPDETNAKIMFTVMPAIATVNIPRFCLRKLNGFTGTGFA